MAKLDFKHLSLKGQQYQFRKRWPAAIAKRKKTQFYVVNLGTADAKQAHIKRDLILAELDREAYDVEQTDTLRRLQYQQASDEERELLLDKWVDEQERELAKDPANRSWLAGPDGEPTDATRASVRKVELWTGQRVPLQLHLERFLKENPVAPSTDQGRREAIQRFDTWTGKKPLDEIDRRLVGRYVSHLADNGLASATVNGHISHLQSYFRFLLRKDLVESNPFVEQSLKKQAVVRRDPWTQEECRWLIAQANESVLIDLCWLAPLTGMRAQDIAGLRVRDVEDGFFVIREGKTAAAARRVPIHSKLRTLLDQRCSGKAPDDFLFHEFEGDRKKLTKKFGRWLDKLFPERRLGAPQASKTLHSYRHFVTDSLLKQGVQVHEVQQIVGHEAGKSVTLRTYYHGMTDDRAKEIIELLDV